MIPAEDRMRETRTPGSTSRGAETDPWESGLSAEARVTENAPDPNRQRATP